MSKVLVVGGLGNIGSRYCAILKWLGHEPLVYDTAKEETSRWPEPEEYDRHIIIATPTDTHYEWCMEMNEEPRYPIILCEKPLSTSLTECNEIKTLRKASITVVNNYDYALHRERPLVYNYFKSGRDGLAWDCCQLIRHNEDIKLFNDSPMWRLETNLGQMSYSTIERSYIHMLWDWLHDGSGGMGVPEATSMTERVLRRIDADHARNTGTK